MYASDYTVCFVFMLVFDSNHMVNKNEYILLDKVYRNNFTVCENPLYSSYAPKTRFLTIYYPFFSDVKILVALNSAKVRLITEDGHYCLVYMAVNEE